MGPAVTSLSPKSSMTRSVLVGDDVQGNETEESDGGDENSNDETPR